MQHIFINCHSIEYPDYFTKYYNSAGETYQRIESKIDSSSFLRDKDAVRVELYRNSTSKMVMPVLVEVVERFI